MSPEGVFGIRPTGGTGIWREKMHVHIRRQHLVLGSQIPATEEKFCLCIVLLHVGLGSVCKERSLGRFRYPDQDFSCYSLSNKARRKKAGKENAAWGRELGT